MSKLTLVLMAAGKGSRYGGLKQLEKFGPQEATLAEYALWDAISAGFDSFIVVVNENTQPYFEQLFRRMGVEKKAQCVLQTMTNVPLPHFELPKSRQKPWGTGHALWCAARYIHSPFVIINADDFYGPEAYNQAAKFLEQANGFALIGYNLSNTLSPYGSVSRAVCSVDSNGILQDLKEYKSIEEKSGELIAGTQYFKGDETVSVNFWALQPSFLAALEVELQKLLTEYQNSETAECYLPEVIIRGAQRFGIKIHVLPAKDQWLGVTYPQDKDWVNRRLYELTAQKLYPSILWS